MTDQVVVTLRTEGGFCFDFELPAKVKLGELYPRLLTALKNASNRFFAEWENLLLETEEGLLVDMSATLYDYGICTGFYLNVVRRDEDDGI